MKTIKMASTVIVYDGRIYAVQRGCGNFKGKWGFPGAKIEKNGTAFDAAIWGAEKELNAEIRPDWFLGKVKYSYSKCHLIMYYGWCHIVNGCPNLVERSDAKWLGRDELESVDWLPADGIAVQQFLIKKDWPDTCPVCGTEQIAKIGEICPVCGWERDELMEERPWYDGGANRMSLNEARKMYAEGKTVW